MYLFVRSQVTWGVNWHLRVDGGPLFMAVKVKDKCTKQWSREQSQTVIDTGAIVRGQSHVSKKRGHRFCCPLNKQRDISAQSFCSAVSGSNRHHQTKLISLFLFCYLQQKGKCILVKFNVILQGKILHIMTWCKNC